MKLPLFYGSGTGLRCGVWGYLDVEARNSAYTGAHSLEFARIRGM